MINFFRNILQYNHSHSDFPLQSEQLEAYVPKSLVYALLWSFAGDAKLKVRSDLGDFLRSITTIPLPAISSNMPIIDYEVSTEKTKKIDKKYRLLGIFFVLGEHNR